MVEVKMQLPNELATQVQVTSLWMPTILELNFARFKTRVAMNAWEIAAFLAQNPSPQEVLDHHASERAQSRLRRLLNLNKAGKLTEKDQHELDEMERLNHIVFMLKMQAIDQIQQS